MDKKQKTIETLCIIHQHQKILLGFKKQGLGIGRWNGFGGHVNASESIEDAATREVFEEAGIEVKELKKIGIMECEFKGSPEILEVHIFRGDNFSGEPSESEEMKPQWFPVDKIPFDSMWPDDKFWMPLFLGGKKFVAKFLFGDSDAIISHELTEVKEV